MTIAPRLIEATYVLPLRWDSPPAGRGRSATAPIEELAAYIARLASAVEVIVVDGSPPERFAEHHAALAASATHIRPDAAFSTCRNGKVAGVLTGVARARHEAVIIADDDVRYEREELQRVVDQLQGAGAVRPGNYFRPLPWHARWDTARILIARALGGDFAGTVAVRRSSLLAAGGYDGDVLFENLELIRTIEAVGGHLRDDMACLIRRVPPDTRRFLGQRVRQAYDEFARPARMAVSLAVLPSLFWLGLSGRIGVIAAGAASAVVEAEFGRRRSGGRRWFPASSSLLAPAWALERGICSWIAVGWRLAGGCPYAGGRLVRAATPARHLRQKLAARVPSAHQPVPEVLAG